MVKNIVISGGPCSGKTTGLARLCDRLPGYGVYPVVIPETARELIAGGIRPDRMIPYLFQRTLFKLSRDKENAFLRAVRNLDLNPWANVAVLFDRGLMDSRAYLQPDEFDKLLRGFGTTVTQTRDGHYDTVIYLRSAAIGAEKFYCTDTARMETLEQARDLDERTLEAWTGHPHLVIIDNSTDFETKMDRLEQAVCHALGIPEPLEIEQKFLVEAPRVRLNARPIKIKQYYLSTAFGQEGRIRMRGEDDAWIYFHTVKHSAGPGASFETERIIDEREFNTLLAMRDPNRGPIEKTRYCFVHENQYFELDDLSFVEPGLWVLEIERTDRSAKHVSFPSWTKVLREVTDDPAFRNHALSLRTVGK